MSPKPYLALFILIFLIGCGGGQTTAVVVERPRLDAPPVQEETGVRDLPVTDELAGVEVGRFDTGKMWTFENPPADYFAQRYGFRPDSQWFAQARLATLRIPGCTASFVSSAGLILTNHHCARTGISEVTGEVENLLDDGFFASSLDAERRVPDLYAERLVDVRDVTADVRSVGQGLDDPAAARRRRAEQLERRLDAEAKARDSTLTVEVVELYHGGRYSAYTYRRFDDVRLVFAPELKIGAFGGDPDNFTFPRYSLDFTFLRAYDHDGEPVRPEHHFAWSTTGTTAGEPVFVVGNPGTTSRLNTVSQLEFERDYVLPFGLEVLESRLRILEDYVAAHPEEVHAFDLRNVQHQLSNQVKKNRGELEGLHDPDLMARRLKAERDLQERIAANDSLREQYGSVVGRIADLQRAKAGMSRQAGAFTYFASSSVDSHVLVRAVYGYVISLMRQRGAPPDQINEMLEEALKIKDWPPELEKRMLAARLYEIQRRLGPGDATVNRVLQSRSPDEAASEFVETTAIADSASYANLLEEGFLDSSDPTVALAQALTPFYFTFQQQLSDVESRERDLNARLSQARFHVYGTEIPPDATFTLRIADGVVAGYPYNGTVAAPYTTFYGMYDRYHSFGGEGTDWDLPEPWLDLPEGFDFSIPVNLVTTNDITGGNSGSPLLNTELEVVGVVFDSNIDALPNTYVYLDERGRAISVDARAIFAALNDVYGADRLVVELSTGELVAAEEDVEP